MLSYRLSRNHAGPLLIGDYTSLRWLHEVLHDVNDRSPLIEDKEGLFLGLAYDVRKAFEGQREIIKPPTHEKHIGVRYGVRLIWPVLLIQQRLLRASLAFMDTSARMQAITYALEAVIEDALTEDFPLACKQLIELWKQLPTDSVGLAKLDSRGALFCSWPKGKRARMICSLLASFFNIYEITYARGIQAGEKDLVDPAELERWGGLEWPDPKW